MHIKTILVFFFLTLSSVLFSSETQLSPSIIDKEKNIDIYSDIKKLEQNYRILLYSDNNNSVIDKTMAENNKIFQELYSTIYIEDKKKLFQNKFFNQLEYQNKIQLLERRIDTNAKYNSILPIFRDTFELNDLKVKLKLAKLLKYINTVDSKDDIVTYISKEREELKGIDPSHFKDFIKENILSGIKTKQKTRTYELFKQYRIDYILFTDFLNFVDVKNKINIGEKIIKELYISKVIKYINDLSIFSTINSFLKTYNLDVGRIIVSSIFLIFFYILGKIINYLLKLYISKKYANKNEEEALLEEASLNMKNPLLSVMFVSALQVSFWVLFFNKDISSNITLLLNVLYILTIYWFVISLVSNFFAIILHSKKYSKKMSMRHELVNLGLSSIKVILTIITFIILLHFFGVDVSGILTGLGVSGMVIAFAAKDLLSNFFGTVKIIMDDSYSQGDWIEVGGNEGTVASISFGNTKIRTFENGYITVPNSIVSSSAILNWSRRTHGRQIKTTLGLTYNSKREDILNAIKEINEMLEEHEGIATPKKSFNARKTSKKDKLISIEDTYGIKRTLFVKFVGFSDSSIDILIYAYSKTVNWGEFMDVRQDVYLKIWDIIERNNLEFAFPSRTLYIEDNSSIK